MFLLDDEPTNNSLIILKCPIEHLDNCNQNGSQLMQRFFTSIIKTTKKYKPEQKNNKVLPLGIQLKGSLKLCRRQSESSKQRNLALYQRIQKGTRELDLRKNDIKAVIQIVDLQDQYN